MLFAFFLLQVCKILNKAAGYQSLEAGSYQLPVGEKKTCCSSHYLPSYYYAAPLLQHKSPVIKNNQRTQSLLCNNTGPDPRGKPPGAMHYILY